MFSAVLIALLQIAASAQQPAEPSRLTAPARDSVYQLGPDDQISLHVVQGEEVNGRDYKVGPDGDISVPMIGRVHAAGLTVDQLEDELRARFSRYLERPQLTVSVTDYRSQPVFLVGAVMRPGTVYLRSRKTVLDAINEAGGLRPEAGPAAMITRKGTPALSGPTVKKDPDGATRLQIDLQAATAGDPSQNIQLVANDVVHVSESQTVYVLGEVGRQGGVPISGANRVTIMQLISTSGGLTKTAAAKEIRILRQVPGSTSRRELKVNFKAVLAGTSQDIPLVPNDIVFVPDNRGKRIAARVIEGAVNAGTSILTWGTVYR